ncbi:MAG: ABC transporter ATP-binding protein [Ilumatobacteraceae bacterium]|jgi:iron complex transport system ATP-binding protein|nr:ABC transporter ATP-binding protein [Ilumatobacteraceae bacterium]
MTAIGFCDLTVAYNGTNAVVGFNDLLHSGEWLCLIGPNGAGKSSVLRAAAGLVPYMGSVAINQTEIPAASARWRAQHIAYVPQAPVIPTDMSVYEYVLLGRNPYINYFSSETSHDRDVIDRVLNRLDLVQFSARKLGTLSGGEVQRLVIARALAQEAPVLLLDEPTSALDIGHQQQALELVDSLRREQGLTIISAMHDLTLAGLYADRLVLMHEGHRVAEGTAKQVLKSETLAEFYGVSARVHHEPDGTVVVIPQRSSHL